MDVGGFDGYDGYDTTSLAIGLSPLIYYYHYITLYLYFQEVTDKKPSCHNKQPGFCVL